MSAPNRVRAAGFVATGLLAVSAYLAGALPDGDPAPSLRSDWSAPVTYWWGLGTFLAGAVLLCMVWWQPDRLPWSRPPAAPSVGAVLVTGAVWALPLVIAPPLASRDVYSYACQGATYAEGLDPYAAGAAEAGCPWLAAVPEIWQHSTTPYGPLGVAVTGGVAQLADGRLWLAVLGLRAVAIMGLGLVAFSGVRLARSCGATPAAALWAGLITPAVMVHAVSGAHNDALVAGLLVAGLALAAWCRSPDRSTRMSETSTPILATTAPVRPPVRWWVPVAAGMLTAGAVAIKVTALAALPFVLILAGRRWWQSMLGAGVTFAGVTFATGLGLGWIRALSSTQEVAQWSSVPTGLGMAAGYMLRALGYADAAPTAIVLARFAGLAALAAVGLIAVRRAWRADTAGVVAACGWTMAAVALLGPVFYPWYAIAPLAVLACTRTGLVRARAAATVAVVFLALPNGLGIPVLTKGPGAFAVLIGVAVLTWCAVRARPRATA